MEYIFLFLEGIITFISPCLLPMLPVYVSYFAASETNKSHTVTNSIGFVSGFTIIFVIMGAFSGTFGRLISDYRLLFNIVTGTIVIAFGLNFLGVLNIEFINRIGGKRMKVENLSFFSSLLFGIVFSLSWTPCVGAFLASALLIASLKGTLLKGISMLLAFSLGLGIPFIISALLIDQLKGTLDFIKKNYKTINLISGSLLVFIGVLMVTGYMGYFLSLLTF